MPVAEQKNVRQFAEFLLNRHLASGEPAAEPATEPLNLPKPPGETAVKALKRLKKSYPMIEADMTLLEEASRLVMKRAMGASDEEVTEELEALFANRYRLWRDGGEKGAKNQNGG